MKINKDFRDYCRNLTNTQLENVLAKEFEASQTDESREEDYEAAKIEAELRGLI